MQCRSPEAAASKIDGVEQDSAEKKNRLDLRFGFKPPFLFHGDNNMAGYLISYLALPINSHCTTRVFRAKLALISHHVPFP